MTAVWFSLRSFGGHGPPLQFGGRITCVTCWGISGRLDPMKSMPDLRSRVVVAAGLFLAANGIARAQTIAELPDNRFQSVVEDRPLREGPQSRT
jgi:hypothetical protein